MTFDQDPLLDPSGPPDGGGVLAALARLLARQAAAEAWAESRSGGARDADPEADVADHHEPERKPDSDDKCT